MNDITEDKMKRIESVLWQFLSLDQEGQEVVLRKAELITH